MSDRLVKLISSPRHRELYRLQSQYCGCAYGCQAGPNIIITIRLSYLVITKGSSDYRMELGTGCNELVLIVYLVT